MRSVPAGASLTDVTLIVMVFADASRSLPAFAVLALPISWPVMLVLSCAVFVVGLVLARALPPDLMVALRRRQSNSP